MKYNGVTLNFEPKNGSIASLVELLSKDRSVYVHLEPGDATRYEIIITPMWGTARSPHVSALPWKFLLVTRLTERSDDSYPTILIHNAFWNGEFAPLANNNEYTQDLLSYFLMLVFEAAGDRAHPQKDQLIEKYP